MNVQTKEAFKELVRNVKRTEQLLDAVVFENDYKSITEYDKAYETAFKLNSEAIEDLTLFALPVFCRNKDITIQKTVNYYLKRANIKTFKLNA